MYNLMSTATCFSSRAGLATGLSSFVSHNNQYNSMDAWVKPLLRG